MSTTVLLSSLHHSGSVPWCCDWRGLCLPSLLRSVFNALGSLAIIERVSQRNAVLYDLVTHYCPRTSISFDPQRGCSLSRLGLSLLVIPVLWRAPKLFERIASECLTINTISVFEQCSTFLSTFQRYFQLAQCTVLFIRPLVACCVSTYGAFKFQWKKKGIIGIGGAIYRCSPFLTFTYVAIDERNWHGESKRIRFHTPSQCEWWCFSARIAHGLRGFAMV